MNQKFNLRMVAAALGFLISTGSGFAQGTAFTYQGRLNAGGNAASGFFDLLLPYMRAATSGTQQAISRISHQALEYLHKSSNNIIPHY